jgi:hypothetical protein
MHSEKIEMEEEEQVEIMDDGKVERVSSPKALTKFWIASGLYLPVGAYTAFGLIGYLPFTQGYKWMIWAQTILLVWVVRQALPLRISPPVLLALMLTALFFGPTVFVYFDAWASGTGNLDVDVLEFVTQDTKEYLQTHERF